MADTSKTAQLTTLKHELSKSYIQYDVSDRMEIAYEAAAATGHGEPCLKTEYAYDGGSSRIIKRKESVSTWDSSWDI